MSSFLSQIPSLSIANLLHLIGIIVAALLVNHLLKLVSKLIVKPAGSQSKAAQAREQQTRTLAAVVYSASSKVVWALAILVAAQEFGVNVTPVAAVAGLASLAVGFGAQNLVRDIISGFYIILEDQYGIGDTIQVADTIGRVEHLTLRRTVVRDPRGALVTLSNGDIRTVGNLSRDWSQTFVDVAVSPEVPQDHALQALDAAAAELRNDPSWSQALVDGPRILGLQSFDQTASVVRLQVRTAPARHEDVARELRRRIQLQFQRQGIALSNVRRIELVKPSGSPLADSPAPPA
ncbi:MAG TPA: mechanosensitive ion channel family protein [Candidatus Saccharimonadales bacterium]|nr:mechanosensitive ion channel family protein [Candidatus Saccharimonadales bacterium]